MNVGNTPFDCSADFVTQVLLEYVGSGEMGRSKQIQQRFRHRIASAKRPPDRTSNRFLSRSVRIPGKQPAQGM